jgi:rhamnose utilization protein RhaD (predicted bifunctional aldolase and dehydrogenase)
LTAGLGRPERDFVILGEGNTSVRVDDESFLVKASGYSFVDATEESFVHVRFAPVLALLEGSGPVAEDDLKAAYAEAKVDPGDPRRPSVETVFHAALLQFDGVDAVAHTHPTDVNALTCSAAWPACCEGRLFPDEAVVCGPASALVPYLDPGVELARAIRRSAEAHRQTYGAAPKVVLMQNHGLIACGADTAECDRITAMAVKAARIRLGALAGGGIADLGAGTTQHLLDRPDERYRQQLLAGEG